MKQLNTIRNVYETGMKIGDERRHLIFSYISGSQMLGGTDGGDLKKKVIGRSVLSSNQSRLFLGVDTVHMVQGEGDRRFHL